MLQGRKAGSREGLMPTNECLWEGMESGVAAGESPAPALSRPQPQHAGATETGDATSVCHHLQRRLHNIPIRRHGGRW